MNGWDLVADLCWLPLVWLVVIAWEWISLHSCQFLARFASPVRRREWGYE